jgi:hypothetical protein
MPIPAAHVPGAHALSPPVDLVVAHAVGRSVARSVPHRLTQGDGPRDGPGLEGAPIALPLWARVLRRLARGSSALPPSAGGWCV